MGLNGSKWVIMARILYSELIINKHACLLGSSAQKLTFSCVVIHHLPLEKVGNFYALIYSHPKTCTKGPRSMIAN